MWPLLLLQFLRKWWISNTPSIAGSQLTTTTSIFKLKHDDDLNNCVNKGVFLKSRKFSDNFWGRSDLGGWQHWFSCPVNASNDARHRAQVPLPSRRHPAVGTFLGEGSQALTLLGGLA